MPASKPIPTPVSSAVAPVPQTAYLEAIAELTAKRDSHALARALVDGIRRFTSAQAVRLLALCNENNDREFNEGNIHDVTVRDLLAGTDAACEGDVNLDDLRACVTGQRAIVRGTGASERQFLPVRGVRYLAGVLLIEGAIGNSERELIDYLLRIYSNQLVLMGKGEFDALTGLLNRQAFDDRMKKVMSGEILVGRDGQADGLSFAIIDIDYFKQVNDKFGHLFGDEVLLLMARLMTRSFRQCDMLFRYGGEEFAVLMTHKLDKSLIGLERFRAAVESFEFPQIGHKTVSIGVVEINSQELLSTIIDKADKALYYAKNNGRNQIGVYERLRDEGLVGEAQKAGGDVELF